MKKYTDYASEIRKLETRLIEAVAFAPEDTGEDDTTEITVSLADLRELICCAWEIHRTAKGANREARENLQLLREAEHRAFVKERK